MLFKQRIDQVILFFMQTHVIPTLASIMHHVRQTGLISCRCAFVLKDLAADIVKQVIGQGRGYYSFLSFFCQSTILSNLAFLKHMRVKICTRCFFLISNS